MDGYGPHDIIGLAEILGTIVVLALAMVVTAWMVYETHRRQH